MKRLYLYRREITFIIITVVFCLGILLYLHFFMPSSFKGEWKEVKISEGTNYTEGINILREEGIIKNDFLLLLLGRITMTDRKLRAGYYYLSASMGLWDVFNRLRKGLIIEYTITLQEGATLEDIKSKLIDKGLIDEESWKLVEDKDFLASLGIKAPSLEGYLYPDTYNLAKGMKTGNILRIMVERLREKIEDSLMKRAKKLGMSENEVLTLASIIEKEAKIDEERPLISAVYHNRLRKKMPLQADPTAIYGVKKNSEKITKSDLRRHTKYNTYAIKGLPPGPIASPGIKSIKAALYPADANYLYFVSKNDGTHHFSHTGEEHLKAVMLYQRSNNLKEDSSTQGTK